MVQYYPVFWSPSAILFFYDAFEGFILNVVQLNVEVPLSSLGNTKLHDYRELSAVYYVNIRALDPRASVYACESVCV